MDFAATKSKPLLLFTSCFLPFCSKDEEGKKQRKIGFRAADPNGNGLCSLAELETWLLKCLLYTFKKEMNKQESAGGGCKLRMFSIAAPPPPSLLPAAVGACPR